MARTRTIGRRDPTPAPAATTQREIYRYANRFTLAVKAARTASSDRRRLIADRLYDELVSKTVASSWAIHLKNVQKIVTRLIRESAVRYDKDPHIPGIILSARTWVHLGITTNSAVNFLEIAEDDPKNLDIHHYRPDTETPIMDPGSEKWWEEGTSTPVSRSVTRESPELEALVKVEPGIVDVPKFKIERRTASVGGTSEKGHGIKVDDVEGEDEIAGSEDEGFDERTPIRLDMGPSKKAKGKQRAVESPPPAAIDSAPVAKASGMKRKAEAAVEEDETAPVSKPTKQTKNDVRPMKKARTQTPARQLVEDDEDELAAPCPRCARRGTACINVPGQACKSCNKSKVKCPLYTGRRQQKAATTKEVKGAVAIDHDEDHEFFFPLANNVSAPSPQRGRSKSRARSVKASGSGSRPSEAPVTKKSRGKSVPGE
jgi:hypothetical protein